MKLSINVTPKKVFVSLVWLAGGFVLLGALGLVLFLLSAHGDSGVGYVVMGIMMVAQLHFYLLLAPILTVGIGVARDTKAGKSAVWSIVKWFLAGMAVYVVLLGLAFRLSF